MPKPTCMKCSASATWSSTRWRCWSAPRRARRCSPSEAKPALPLPPAIPVGLPASLLSQRPDLAASVASLRAANAQVGVAEGMFYPSLSLTSNFGYASQVAARPGRRQRAPVLDRAAGPVAAGLRRRPQQGQPGLYKARYEEAVANHENRLLTALREVEDALSDAQQRQKQGDVQAQAQQAASRALLVAQARYERGVSTYLDVTDAQRSALARTAPRADPHPASAGIGRRGPRAGWRLVASAALATVADVGWACPRVTYACPPGRLFPMAAARLHRPTPILGIHPIPHIPVKRRMLPLGHIHDKSMLHRIEMHIIHMPLRGGVGSGAWCGIVSG
jgi:hypothetical protein